MTRFVVIYMLLTLANAFQKLPNPLWNHTWTDLLKHDLFLTYDKFARPTQQYNTTHIKMSVVFRHIIVDEKQSLVTVHAWSQFLQVFSFLKPESLATAVDFGITDHFLVLCTISVKNLLNNSSQFLLVTKKNYVLLHKLLNHMDWIRALLENDNWTDGKLKWNASEYGGQYRVHVASHEIWQPDIVLYNSAQGSDIDHYGNTHVLLQNGGEVLWVPPSEFHVFCNINLRKWPYDKQTCLLKFGSWTYSINEINLDINTAKKLVSMIDKDTCEWDLLSTSKKQIVKYYDCCTEGYPNLDFDFTIQRKSSLYTGLVFPPALVSIALTLSVFWLSPTAREKFLLSGVTIIILTFFMIYFNHRLSVITGNMPVIIEFYIYSLVLVCLSLVTSVVSVNSSRHPKSKPVPWIMTQLLTSRVGMLLRLPHIKNHGSFQDQDCEELHDRSLVSDMTQDDSKTNTTNGVHEWILFAMAIDRLLFIAYILIFVILLIILLLT